MARISSGDSGSISVDGIVELQRALKAMDNKLPRKLTAVNKKVAKFVATDARAAAHALGSTAAHVAPSLKATASATSAGVGSSHPAFAGAEFGGRGRPTTMQFQPHRGNGAGAGYFLYPTIRKDGPRIESEYGDGVDELLRQVGLK